MPARALLLHGFTCDRRMWAPLTSGLGPLRVAAPDLPGHGRCPPPHPGARFLDVVDACARELEAPFGVIGYSMGARLGLALATRHPEKVSWLVLDGATLGLPTEAERADRRASDAVWCTLLRTQGIAAFARAWEAQPLFGGRAAHPLRLEQNAEGLAAALECLGKGVMPWLGSELSRVRCPVLLINGEHDAKGLVEAERVSAALPHARRVTLAGHHAVHAEAPDAWRACVAAFISEQLLTRSSLEATA